MAKKIRGAPDRGSGAEEAFRIRPNRPHSSGKGEARAWSTALRTILRYAGTSRRSKAPAISGSGGRARKRFNQRCAVRTMYSANKTPGQWRAHGRYIARESVGGAALGHVMCAKAGIESPDGRDQPVLPAKELERWQSEGDSRLWKLIVSPEFGERLDLDWLTRDLMARMEKDLRTRLEWVAERTLTAIRNSIVRTAVPRSDKPSPGGHTGFGHREFFQWSRTCPHCAQTRGALPVAVFFLPAIELKSYGYAGDGVRSQRQLLPYERQELHLPAGYRGRYLSGSCDPSFEHTRVNVR